MALSRRDFLKFSGATADYSMPESSLIHRCHRSRVLSGDTRPGLAHKIAGRDSRHAISCRDSWLSAKSKDLLALYADVAPLDFGAFRLKADVARLIVSVFGDS